jgi:hypothetical protein
LESLKIINDSLELGTVASKSEFQDVPSKTWFIHFSPVHLLENPDDWIGYAMQQ